MALDQVTITLPRELHDAVRRVAERETRTVAQQIRHFVAKAMNGADKPAQRKRAAKAEAAA